MNTLSYATAASTSTSTSTSASLSASALRFAALTISVTTLAAMVALFHHPVLRGAANAREALVQMVALGALDNWVHGVLIAMLALLACALAVFGQLVGANRPAARVAIIAYCLGCALLVVAMLFDGFVLPQLARRYAAATSFEIDVVRLMLGAIGATVQVFSKAGFVAMSVAMLAWSWTCASRHAALPSLRGCALIGVVAGCGPACVILLSDLVLRPTSLMAIFAAHSVWYLAVAILLFRASWRAGKGGAAS